MRLDDPSTDRTGALLRQVAREIVLPRFGRLAEHEAHEKSPGELVTIVDGESEALLARELTALLPGSRVVGEEAASADASLLQTLGDGAVWVIDPLDGTRNFAGGSRDFAVMVALLVDGATQASWILDPLADRLCVARRGEGAWCDGSRLRVPAHEAGTSLQSLRATVKTGFLPAALRPDVERRRARIGRVGLGRNSAGIEYPALIAGEVDLAFYWRTLPWDHAPGVLLLQEAGGHAADLDGRDYAPALGRAGLLVAHDATIWTQARRALLED